MRRFLLPAAILCAALFLASCATNLQEAKPDFTFKPGKPGDKPKGLLAVTLTYHGGPLDYLLWRVRPVSTAKPRSNTPVGGAPASSVEVQPSLFAFGYFHRDMVVEWPPPYNQSVPANRLAGRVAVVELNAGTYELYRWEAKTGQLLLSSGATPPKVRFTIEPNKVKYIGDLHLFWENPAYRVGMYDMKDRDLPIIKKKVPLIPEDQIVVELSEVEKTSSAGGEKPGTPALYK